jgi:hypothetical protein
MGVREQKRAVPRGKKAWPFSAPATKPVIGAAEAFLWLQERPKGVSILLAGL